MTREFATLIGGILVLAIVLFGVVLLVDFRRPEILLAAIFSVLGNCVTVLGGLALFREQSRQSKRKEEADRDEERRRALIALRSELVMAVQAQARFFGADVREAGQASAIRNLHDAKDGERSMPSGAVARSSVVFDAVRGKLTDLPPDVIGPLIAYYGSDEAIVELLRGFYEDRFERLSLERRETAIRGLYAYGSVALDEAIRAFDAVDRALERDARTPLTQEERAEVDKHRTSPNDGSQQVKR